MRCLAFAVVLLLASLSARGTVVQLVVSVPSADAERIAKSERLVVGHYRRNDGNAISMGGSFCGVTLLLTGDPWTDNTPLGRAVMGGRVIHRDGRKWPATLLLSPEQVAESSKALSEVHIEGLRARFDVNELHQRCIDSTASNGTDDEVFEYLMGHLSDLTRFYSKTAKEGRAMLTFIWFDHLPLEGADESKP
jgi:hypothetical protein